MFDSDDDFDQILSQLDFPEVMASKDCLSELNCGNDKIKKNILLNPTPCRVSNDILLNPETTKIINESPNDIIIADSDKKLISPKQTKRQMLEKFFDKKGKRKFPGPAGLLIGNLSDIKDEFVCKMELSSEDVDFLENSINKDAFDSALWHRVLEDVKEWNLCAVDTIEGINQCNKAGTPRRWKTQTVVAFVETVDRSSTDPLITLSDPTGTIKCTLHREAWSAFSPYVVAEYCALVLNKPTILTRGKKHYLIITLSNIFAIYSSAILKDDDIKDLPEGYVKFNESDYTVIKANEEFWKSKFKGSTVISTPESQADLEGLDSIFSDEIF